MSWWAVALGLAASVPAVLRWLRVAQREHYLAGSVSRFAVRWWSVPPWNPLILIAGFAGALVAVWFPPAGVLVAVVGAVGPVGLGVRGTTSPLAWTERLRRLAIVVGVGSAALLVVGWFVPALALALPLLVPAVVDGSLVALAPWEHRRGNVWIRRAAARISEIGPEVVAITGSYGKTSTKGVLAHLLTGTRSALASPASFNNRMGLARTVNEHLSPGVDVFIAEMGIYGPGEIREMCTFVPPDVGVITAIGPVHLERMKTEENIAAAKREILEEAKVAVLQIDHPLLEQMAREEDPHRRVIRCSTRRPDSDVAVLEDGRVLWNGAEIGRAGDIGEADRSNLACALGAIVALGIDPATVAHRLADVPVTPHRRAVGKSERGFTIIDDTYNSNPAGARAALEVLASEGDLSGRRVVVTPGMVELGPRQQEENERFAAEAARIASHLIVVGHTNRHALVQGAAGGAAQVMVLPSRRDAVEWVREHLGEGDAVLYENDLPDHYP